MSHTCNCLSEQILLAQVLALLSGRWGEGEGTDVCSVTAKTVHSVLRRHREQQSPSHTAQSTHPHRRGRPHPQPHPP